MLTIPNASGAAFPSQAGPDSGDIQALVSGFSNTGHLSGCAVTAQAAPNMTVAVAAGVVKAAGVPAYVAAANPAIAANGSGNPRFDLIVVTAGAVAVVQGAPAAAPEYPPYPATSVLLAAVYVPAGVAAITGTMIVDKRVSLFANDGHTNAMLFSRVQIFGHSYSAGASAYPIERGWGAALAAMLKAEYINTAIGGSVLAFSERGMTGDGGYASLVNKLDWDFGQPEVNWTGPWTSGKFYNPRDGVLSGGNWYVWGGNAGSSATPAPPGGGWVPITSPNSIGSAKYSPRPELVVPFYGNNDLGHGVGLALFREALTYAFSVCSASVLYDDDWGCITYDASFGARSAANRTAAYGSGFRTIPNTNGATCTINIPADFPGGAVALLFIVAAGAAKRIDLTVDGAGAGNKIWGATGLNVPTGYGTLNQAGGAVAGEVASFAPSVVRLSNLAAGPHTITFAVNTAVAGASAVYFDGVTIENGTALPKVLFPSLAHIPDYTIWNNKYGFGIGDADVDAWNTDLQATVLPLFPNVTWVDISNWTGMQGKYYWYDNVHPNNEAHALLASILFDAVKKNMTMTSLDAARQAHRPIKTAGPILYPANGETLTMYGGWRDDCLIQLPAGPSSVTIVPPSFSTSLGGRKRITLMQPAGGGCTVNWSGLNTNAQPPVDLESFGITFVDIINVGTDVVANWAVVDVSTVVDSQLRGGGRRAFATTGPGFGMFTTSRRNGVCAVAQTAVYTAPAVGSGGAAVSVISNLWLANVVGSAQTITVYAGTAATAANQCGVVTIAANGTAQVLVPPLPAGASLWLGGSVSVNYQFKVYSVYEPGWVVSRLSAVAAGAITQIYTPSGTKQADFGPVLAGKIAPLLCFNTVATTHTTYTTYPPGGQLVVHAVAAAAGVLTSMLDDAHLENGDSVAVRNITNAGSNYWLLAKEY